MSNIQILDCTLRDGGYINNWNFGKEIIENISKNLAEAKTDIIEVGFLTDMPHTEDQSLFSQADELSGIVSNKKTSKLAGMIALGEKEINPLRLPNATESGLDIIRITFHNDEKEIDRAISFANLLKDKGYEVCMQPVGTTAYTDKELVSLISKINDLQPYAFYLVDTLGTLYKDTLMHFVDLIDEHLDPDIKLGFHSHNNLQMSFSNAQLIIDKPTDREFIIDSSLYGMGRGAGNLCTELVTRYLNDKGESDYNLVPILDAIDNYIYPISLKLHWGYNAHYYMSAIHGCHPNYSSYLMNIQTLTMNDVNLILQNLPSENRHLFNKKLIEDLYMNFQNTNAQNTENTESLSEISNANNILVLAPGHTLVDYEDKIKSYIDSNDSIVVSINALPVDFNVDYTFISNRKRLLSLDHDKNKSKLIVTSNLPKLTDKYACVDYDELCDSEFEQPDNAGIMLLRLINKLGVKNVTLAGFDGFTTQTPDNYYSYKIANYNTEEVARKKTEDITNQIRKLEKSMNIDFLTPSLYEGKSNEQEKI